MTALSEKAKGKQRAVEPQSQAELEGPSSSPRSLTVRFTDGSPDISVTVNPKDTVRQVKIKIRDVRPELSRRRLRLIYSGRMLTDNTILLDWLVSFERKQRKATESILDEDADPVPPAQEINTHWLHCNIGAELGEGEEEEGDVQKTQIKPLRGFDRLAAAGFSEEDIANFRRTFHSQSTGDYLDNVVSGEDEEYDEHARALEEQWIESLDDPGATTVNQTSTSATLLQGLIVGFFFPLLPFFFLREGRPAVFWENGATQERPSSVIFTKRMQMALVLGFMVNITFGVWKYLLGG